MRVFMCTRVNIPVELLEQVADERIFATLNLVDAIFNALGSSQGLTNAAPILRVWRGYKETMSSRLRAEENVELPLMRAYFTPREAAASGVTRRMTMTHNDGKKAGDNRESRYPEVYVGSFLHHIQGGKHGVMAFMRQEGISSLAWYLHFKGARAAYRAKMESMLEVGGCYSAVRLNPELSTLVLLTVFDPSTNNI